MSSQRTLPGMTDAISSVESVDGNLPCSLPTGPQAEARAAFILRAIELGLTTITEINQQEAQAA